MGVSKASVSRCVYAVAECLCRLTSEWIVFPMTTEELHVSQCIKCLIVIKLLSE